MTSKAFDRELHMLITEVQLRGAFDAEFAARLNHIIPYIRTGSMVDGEVNEESAASAIGGAGLALHLDDIATGRWERSTGYDKAAEGSAPL